MGGKREKDEKGIKMGGGERREKDERGIKMGGEEGER